MRQTPTPGSYRKLQGKNPDGTRNAVYPVYLDPENYLDYMLLNIWAGNWDWPNKNFWFARQRTAESTGFKFYTWDFENTLGNNLGRSPTNMVAPRSDIANTWTGQPHYSLKNFSEYKLDFADRVQKFFFNGGLLTPQVLTNRYRQMADQVEPAILAETARWGDDNLSPPQDQADWLRERDWLLGTYLRVRTAIVLQQFKASGLYPALGAPVFSQLGGAVPAGYPLVLSHTNATGAIFYTIAGSDPRVYGLNTVAPAARAYATPLAIDSPTRVRARVLAGTQWSALVEATFYPPQDLSRLALTEIMYHPPNEGTTNSDEFEFLELKNTGTNTLDLSGLYFSAGINFRFTNGFTLMPGAWVVLAGNAAAFGAKYPGVAVGGVYTGKLDNGGERLTLSDPLGATVWSVNYTDQAPWPAGADGTGLSLQRVPAAAYGNEPLHWVAAAPTPGQSYATADTDGDGLPDLWEILHGTQPYVPDAEANPDQDGLTNRQEYLAGTDPKDPASALRFERVEAGPGSITLQFQAMSNHTYTVLCAPSPEALHWTILSDLPAHPTNRTAIVTNSLSGASASFYRLVTPASGL